MSTGAGSPQAASRSLGILEPGPGTMASELGVGLSLATCRPGVQPQVSLLSTQREWLWHPPAHPGKVPAPHCTGASSYRAAPPGAPLKKPSQGTQPPRALAQRARPCVTGRTLGRVPGSPTRSPAPSQPGRSQPGPSAPGLPPPHLLPAGPFPGPEVETLPSAQARPRATHPRRPSQTPRPLSRPCCLPGRRPTVSPRLPPPSSGSATPSRPVAAAAREPVLGSLSLGPGAGQEQVPLLQAPPTPFQPWGRAPDSEGQGCSFLGPSCAPGPSLGRAVGRGCRARGWSHCIISSWEDRTPQAAAGPVLWGTTLQCSSDRDRDSDRGPCWPLKPALHPGVAWRYPPHADTLTPVLSHGASLRHPVPGPLAHPRGAGPPPGAGEGPRGQPAALQRVAPHRARTDGAVLPPPSPGPAVPRVLRPRQLRVSGGVRADGQVLCDHAGQ